MTLNKVYAQPESFRKGWVAGFYDAFSDDGVRYLDDILRYGVEGDQYRTLFLAGYREGRAARRGLPWLEDTGREALGVAAA